MRMLVGIAALLMSSGLSAQTLWNNITADMTKEEVAALYPQAKYSKLTKSHDMKMRLTEGCEVDFSVNYRKERIKWVELSKRKNAADCVNEIEHGLRVRYGEPDQQFSETKTYRYLGFNDSTTFVSKWARDGVMVTLTRDTGGAGLDTVILTYEPISDVSAAL